MIRQSVVSGGREKERERDRKENKGMGEEACCCSICAEEVDPSDAKSTTLECGHHFHVECALRWFRYEHSTCPNCRSSATREVWTRSTPAQRVAALRRKKKTLPPLVRRKLAYLDRTRSLSASLAREKADLHRAHADVFRQEGRLRTRIRHYRNAERQTVQWLSTIVTLQGAGGPLLRYQGTEEEDSSSDGEGWLDDIPL